LSNREFAWYLTGLSDQSRWRITVANEPPTLTGQAAQDWLNMM
jgi:hypothetical protein